MAHYWHTTLAENLGGRLKANCAFSPNFSNFKPNTCKVCPHKGCLIGKEVLTRLEVCLGGLYSEISKIANSGLFTFTEFRPMTM